MHTITTLDNLPSDLESPQILKLTIQAHKALAELKGLAMTIPNQMMLLSTLSLQEAKASSEIENIITTHDDLYQSHYQSNYFTSISAKEVHNYAQAMYLGFDIIQNQGLLTNNSIVAIQETLEQNNAGFRTQMGTQLKNERTGQVIYTPPQNYDDIVFFMRDLERFINDDEYSTLDDLIKLAIIHHQFESIHPFYDGNGRTGRIINVLYLVKQGLLNTPILYLSRYINENKYDYYHLLQNVRDNNDWHSWIVFMLNGITDTAKQTQILIQEIKILMDNFKKTIKEHNEKIYSHELINNLFKYPYTKTEFLVQDLAVHRNTANKYLNELCEMNLLHKQRIGKEHFYINHQLFELLQNNYHSKPTLTMQ